MAENKIKFNKENPAHVKAIKSGDVKIHSGGYFSKSTAGGLKTPVSSKAKLATPKTAKMKAAPKKK